MGAIRTLVDELRRRGLVVHGWTGWDGRGNEGVPQIAPVGAVLHHTATAYGSAFPGLAFSTRSDLYGGALCNFAGNSDGSLTVVASGLAWHAGGGAGPSLGPLSKVAHAMNRYTVGLEIVYPGDQPMTAGQRKAALVFSKAVADLFGGGDIECVRAHGETNGRGGDGKWDPGFAPGQQIDMAAFRREAAAATSKEDDEMTPDQEAKLNKALALLEGLRSALAWPELNRKDGKKIGHLVSEIADVTGSAYTEDRTVGSETDTVKPSNLGDKITEIRRDVKAFRQGGVDAGAIAAAVGAAVRDELAPLFELAKRLES